MTILDKNKLLLSRRFWIALCVALPIQAIVKNASAMEDTRKPFRLISTTCLNQAKTFSYSLDYQTSTDKSVRTTAIVDDKLFQFTLLSNYQPMGTSGNTMWIAEDGSFLEERTLSFNHENSRFSKFAILFDASSGKIRTALVSCTNETEGDFEED